MYCTVSCSTVLLYSNVPRIIPCWLRGSEKILELLIGEQQSLFSSYSFFLSYNLLVFRDKIYPEKGALLSAYSTVVRIRRLFSWGREGGPRNGG